jgi:hypothetical protein
MTDKIDIEKVLADYKIANKKILEFLDEGVLNLVDDTGKEKLKEEEINERATDAELFWRKYYKKRMKVKIYELLYEMCLKAEIPTQVTYYRGMLENCNDEIRWFTEQIGISAENRKKVDLPEGIKPVGESPVG